MMTMATLGGNLLRQYPHKARKKATKGRPDMWGLGLLKSNKRLNNARK